MMEEALLEHANSAFKMKNFIEAEKLYTRFITSCLQFRYMTHDDSCGMLQDILLPVRLHVIVFVHLLEVTVFLLLFLI